MTASPAIVGGVLAAVALGSSALTGTAAAQTGEPASQIVWENDRMQVHRVTLAPGEKVSGESIGGSVIVYLTADLDGRMPAAEAAWREAGVVTMENRGVARFEALVIRLKDGAPRDGGITAPEVVRASGAVAPGFPDRFHDAAIRAQNLIVNDRISVTKERYGVSWPVDPQHVHAQDAVVIHLRGGYVWPGTAFAAPDRVRRGDIRIVPGNVLHTNGSAGSDPLEFLLIIPA